MSPRESAGLLRPLVKRRDWRLQDGFQALAETLTEFDDLRIHVRLVDQDRTSDWAVTGGGAPSVERGPLEDPQIEITTREEIWRRILEGHISPIQAMQSGELRFGGDVELARSLLSHLTAWPDLDLDLGPWVTTAGWVDWIKVSADAGGVVNVRLDPNAPFANLFYVWGPSNAQAPTTRQQIVMELLRDALVNHLYIAVNHRMLSSYIADLRVHAPAGN